MVAVVGFVIMRNNRRSAVEKYKAELRAKGEKISFAELGFPRTPENGEGLRRLTNAVDRIRNNNKFNPGEIATMKFVAPGRVRVSWRSPEVMLSSNQATNWLGWEKLRTHFDGASNDLMEVRMAVEQPIRWFMYDPENMGVMIRYPFVPMRSAAQWLFGDGINALQSGDRSRVLQDIHALAQLTEFNTEDPTLVSQMIRVAITGLGLSMTWEALQKPDWTENDLWAMQRDWERADLLKTFEISFLGERASGDRLFNLIRTNGARQTLRMIAPPRSNSRWNDIEGFFIGAMWRLNAEQDEMLAITHYQKLLECVRDMKQKPWPEIQDSSTNLFATLIVKMDQQAGNAGLNRYKYLFSSMIIPNHTKALLTAERQEMLR